VARAMLEELGADYLIINGSMNGNIDTLRNDIRQFASSVSFYGGRKYVILDEADYLNPNSTQPALRNFMEEFSKNCGFILTANFSNRIIDPLHSRCSVVEFKIEKEDKPKMAALLFKRAQQILESEGIDNDPKAVAEVVKKFFPDFRRVLNELQRYSATGKIDSGILVNFTDEKLKGLIELIKQKNFTEIRKWVGENTDIDTTTFFRKLYDAASDYMKPSSIPQLVLILANYQYKAAFVADQEINILACLTEIMVEGEFK
jgi:DNA polymerase III delta prime subunit